MLQEEEHDICKRLFGLHFWTTAELATRKNQQAHADMRHTPHDPSNLWQAVKGHIFRWMEFVSRDSILQHTPHLTKDQTQQLPAGQAWSELMVLTAAAAIGGWWQPHAEADGGVARGLALHALGECFGQAMADAVAAITR